MGEIFKSPTNFDADNIPNLSVTDYVFSLWRKHLPQVADKPWLVSVDIVCEIHHFLDFELPGRYNNRKANSIQGC